MTCQYHLSTSHVGQRKPGQFHDLPPNHSAVTCDAHDSTLTFLKGTLAWKKKAHVFKVVRSFSLRSTGWGGFGVRGNPEVEKQPAPNPRDSANLSLSGRRMVANHNHEFFKRVGDELMSSKFHLNFHWMRFLPFFGATPQMFVKFCYTFGADFANLSRGNCTNWWGKGPGNPFNLPLKIQVLETSVICPHKCKSMVSNWNLLFAVIYFFLFSGAIAMFAFRGVHIPPNYPNWKAGIFHKPSNERSVPLFAGLLPHECNCTRKNQQNLFKSDMKFHFSPG